MKFVIRRTVWMHSIGRKHNVPATIHKEPAANHESIAKFLQRLARLVDDKGERDWIRRATILKIHQPARHLFIFRDLWLIYPYLFFFSGWDEFFASAVKDVNSPI